MRVARALGETGKPSTVWDGDTPIGYVSAHQAFRVELAPGRHRLVSTAPNNTDVVEAEFLPGKTYYVYLWYTDFLFGQTVNINPLYPGSEKWKYLQEWFSV